MPNVHCIKATASSNAVKKAVALEERRLPNNLDAERSVLGAILVHHSAFDVAAAVLRSSDFFRDAHARIWKAMATLIDRKVAIDFTTLREELTRVGDIDDVGGPSYVSSLSHGVPKATNVTYYAGIVREKAILREVIYAANKVLVTAYEAEDKPEDVLRQADRAFLELQRRKGASRLRPLKDTVGGIFARMEWREANQGKLVGVDTGFPQINELTLGWRKKDMIIVAARPSIGKAQPLHAKVLREDGTWALMGELGVGDELASPDGAPSVVTAIYPQGRKATYRVTFVDGRVVECCGEHLWQTYSTRRATRDALLTTSQIAARLQTKRYQSRLSVPLFGGGSGNDRDWPIDPWLCGFLLGDGTLRGTAVRFATEDAAIVSAVKRSLPDGLTVRHVKGCDYSITTGGRGGRRKNKIKDALFGIGAWGRLAHEKRIPAMFFVGDYETRLSLLRGLLDSDGWAQGSVCFSTTSEGLAVDVQALAHSLGCVARVRPKESTYTHKGRKRQGRPSFTIVITHRDPASLFTLQRKAVKAKKNKRRQHLTIVSVAMAAETTMQCISVSHPTGLYVTDGYVVTHNTVFAMNAAVAAARAGHKVAVFSYEMRREQLEDRILSSLTQIPFYRIELGAFGAADHPKISDALGVISDLPIAIDDRAGQYVSDIRNSCRRLQNEDGLDLVVIDYVQLIPSELARRGASKNEQVTEISRSVKELADELDVPIMLLSQLKRLDQRRPDPRPQLDDLRESGSLEQDADEVNFLHRKNHKESGTTNYIREKARNGPTGTRNLTIDRDCVTFTDGGEDIPEEPPKRRKKKGEKDPDPQAELPAGGDGS